jgi:hypothetical protein
MEGHVYLIKMSYPPLDKTDNMLVKIGFTKNNVLDRLDQLQTGNPFDLHWIGPFREKLTFMILFRNAK